ncbi:MAG: SemiSWEET transporter [Candidatus Thermoplasmatota archaeon]|nr:SemiSWEET transporter [Candidatus Thermoplasmatota archaeon]MBS3802552.1 SemiSWEET transporter [Candidatus Thermoplasmatota archaeon]
MIDLTLLIGYLAALCTTAAFIPQVIHTIKTKSTVDISLYMYLIFLIGVFSWFLYGIYIEALPIILANGITFLLALIVLIEKIRYG